jgi:hypothetical protein
VGEGTPLAASQPWDERCWPNPGSFGDHKQSKTWGFNLAVVLVTFPWGDNLGCMLLESASCGVSRECWQTIPPKPPVPPQKC